MIASHHTSIIFEKKSETVEKEVPSGVSSSFPQPRGQELAPSVHHILEAYNLGCPFQRIQSVEATNSKLENSA